VNSYLGLAKRILAEFPAEISKAELAERKQGKLEEAGRRGLVVRWSEYPTWIAMQDPTTGEWPEWTAVDGSPSVVAEANRHRKKGEGSEQILGQSGFYCAERCSLGTATTKSIVNGNSSAD
jgi:hypothetical protein